MATKEELAKELLNQYLSNPVIQAMQQGLAVIEEFRTAFTLVKFGHLVFDPTANMPTFIDLVNAENKAKFKEQCDNLIMQMKAGVVQLEQMYLNEFKDQP